MNDPDILKLVKEQEDYLIKMRRYFHMNPELSNKEFETRKTIIYCVDYNIPCMHSDRYACDPDLCSDCKP